MLCLFTEFEPGNETVTIFMLQPAVTKDAGHLDEEFGPPPSNT
jgi:hypothetical protein